METEVSIVPATPEHIAPLIADMRPVERQEVVAATGRPLADSVAMSLRHSDVAYAGTVDGDLVAVWGAGRLTPLSDVGVPWMLTTNKVLDHKVLFLRSCDLHNILLPGYHRLRNWVDVRNTLSIRWLRWLGFDVSDTPEPFGPYSLPFYRFEMRC